MELGPAHLQGATQTALFFGPIAAGILMAYASLIINSANAQRISPDGIDFATMALIAMGIFTFYLVQITSVFGIVLVMFMMAFLDPILATISLTVLLVGYTCFESTHAMRAAKTATQPP